MTLVLEIEYLSGVSFAATAPESRTSSWPPQPDRVFSALVASWAARGRNGQEGEALEWLETQRDPLISATGAYQRTAATVYVPPNDPRSGRKKTAAGVIPAMRKRQPRRFPAARPHERCVRFLWPGAEPADRTLRALQALARDTAYVGHSASLTRCRFLIAHTADGGETAQPCERRIYPGRFAELRAHHRLGRRPLPGAHASHASKDAQPAAGIFSRDWLILEHIDGTMPDIRACALVAKTLRDTLLAGYQRSGLGDQIPEIVSGHSADGKPTRAPHLAVVPLAFVGFPYADGHVMGFALVPPHGSGILADADFRRVLRKLAPIHEKYGRRILTITRRSATGGFSVRLSPTFEPPVGKRSLDPRAYSQPARTFATVTPLALDRHLKKKGAARDAEVTALITRGCANVGLPAPASIVAANESALEGGATAQSSRNSPQWKRWHLPPSIASRQLTHAVIRFAEPVSGPVLLGAGRFMGLGLFRPLDMEES